MEIIEHGKLIRSTPVRDAVVCLRRAKLMPVKMIGAIRLGGMSRVRRENTTKAKAAPKETKAKCPFCEGENENARIYEDAENKEYFVYCPVCGIETIRTYKNKTKAIKAFAAGENKGITEPKEQARGDTVHFVCTCGRAFEKPESECRRNAQNCYGTYFVWADCPACGKTCQAARKERTQ